MKKKISEYLKTLEKISAQAQHDIASAPEGNLRAVKHGKTVQFFCRYNGHKDSGVYLKRTDIISRLAQKHYAACVLRSIENQIKACSVFLDYHNPEKIYNVYDNLNPLMKGYVKPYVISDKSYAEKWQNEKYNKSLKEFSEEEYFTSKNERVRSKSEMIIAETLKRFNVPYRYEQCYRLSSGEVVSPDFTVLNVRTREEFIIEHFGMMDSQNYRDSFFWKLTNYSKAGIIPGKNMIMLFEDGKHPLNAIYLEMVIRQFLL